MLDFYCVDVDLGIYDQVNIGDMYARREVIGKIQYDSQNLLVFAAYVSHAENWWAHLVHIG